MTYPLSIRKLTNQPNKNLTVHLGLAVMQKYSYELRAITLSDSIASFRYRPLLRSPPRPGPHRDPRGRARPLPVGPALWAAAARALISPGGLMQAERGARGGRGRRGGRDRPGEDRERAGAAAALARGGGGDGGGRRGRGRGFRGGRGGGAPRGGRREPGGRGGGAGTRVRGADGCGSQPACRTRARATAPARDGAGGRAWTVHAQAPGCWRSKDWADRQGFAGARVPESEGVPATARCH